MGAAGRAVGYAQLGAHRAPYLPRGFPFGGHLGCDLLDLAYEGGLLVLVREDRMARLTNDDLHEPVEGAVDRMVTLLPRRAEALTLAVGTLVHERHTTRTVTVVPPWGSDPRPTVAVAPFLELAGERCSHKRR